MHRSLAVLFLTTLASSARNIAIAGEAGFRDALADAADTSFAACRPGNMGGHDLPLFGPAPRSRGVVSPAACQALCASVAECVAYVFDTCGPLPGCNRSDPSHAPPHCWLKGSLGAEVANTCSCVGYMPEVSRPQSRCSILCPQVQVQFSPFAALYSAWHGLRCPHSRCAPNHPELCRGHRPGARNALSLAQPSLPPFSTHASHRCRL